jgi:type VI protein secretion system component Hcp
MPTAVESITPAKASLLGSVMIGPSELPLSQMTLPQLLASHSLKLVHRRGPASSQIMSAMLKKTILPKVEINTPNGMVTLTNAHVVKGMPSLPKQGTGRQLGSSSAELNDTNELEEFDLTFSKITYTNGLKSKSGQDDWTSQT